MAGGTLYTVIALALAVVGLGFFVQVERSKRKRSEERVEALSRSVDIAQRTGNVLHEIAREKEQELDELGEAHWETQRQLTEKRKELDDAASDDEKIAGLFNEHIKERDGG